MFASLLLVAIFTFTFLPPFSLYVNLRAKRLWVKNDHFGFEIIYVFDGMMRKYYPDFLIRLSNGKMLVLETKGQETSRDIEKRKALAEWIDAVNRLSEYS